MFYMRAKRELAARVFRLFFAGQFGRFGMGTRIIAPVALEGPRRIFLGDHVYVAAMTCLAAMPHTGATECRLEIGDGTQIGRFNHIYATSRITIGQRVLTGNNVYISDNLHAFRDVSRAILDQPVRQVGAVTIGDGAWLGQNVCVIGATVGRNCVVGANSVVTSDIPDFCVAVGAPARIIRRFDQAACTWRDTDSVGNFVEAAPRLGAA